MSCFHTECKCCQKKFKTLYSLNKHYDIKRPNSVELKLSDHEFFDDDNLVVEHPKSGPTKESEGYHLWLSGMSERIAASLHPCLPGKWFKIDCPQVPNEYFTNLLGQLHCPLYGVRQVRHAKLPYSRATRRLSYKLFDIEEFVEVFQIKYTKLFCGERELSGPIVGESEQSASQLLEAAMQKGNTSYSQRVRPTLRSEMVVGLGQGRATREIELIWWPDIYASNHGKLTMRFFVEKVKL